jgi:hypothetical protein
MTMTMVQYLDLSQGSFKRPVWAYGPVRKLGLRKTAALKLPLRRAVPGSRALISRNGHKKRLYFERQTSLRLTSWQ